MVDMIQALIDNHKEGLITKSELMQYVKDEKLTIHDVRFIITQAGGELKYGYKN